MNKKEIEKYDSDKKKTARKQLEENSRIIKNFISFCLEKNITLKEKNFSYIEKIGIVAEYPNILKILNPNLIKEYEVKDEKLISYEILNKYYKKNPGGYFYNKHYIAMAHSYFRRNFNKFNNFAPSFMDLFEKFENKNIDFFIALDLDRVKLDKLFIMECDHWYGAKFNRKIHKIPNNIIQHKPPRYLDERIINFLFGDVYSLDIKWTENKNIKSFYAEELKTEIVKIPVNRKEYHPVRYIHAEYDLNKGYFRHFDGAIHLYEHDEYYERRDLGLNFNNKIDRQIKAKTFKLFKMNGIVNIDTWLTYTSHFFTSNPLIFEYFEGKYPDCIVDALNRIKSNNTVPNLLKK